MHIELLQMPRASGKTTLLIKESAKTGRPIIEPNTASARYVEEQAREMGVKIPEPISATSWHSGYYRGSNFSRIDGFLIDEIDSVLSNIFGKPIGKATYTSFELKPPIENSNKLELKSVPGLEYRVNVQGNIEVNCGSIGGWKLIKTLEEESEVVKMNKFKVGDVVKVKSVEELMDDGLERDTQSHYTIREVRYNGILKEYVYLLNDCDENHYFGESMLEDRTYTEDDIFNINVIVPGKVVEIEFYDGKEKMVCHENDTFDLRKCCFIAIAKHLYKKEYTQEGIEHMATQLMYQKKYVKIVDKALKDYKRKEKEKAEKICREEEEKIIRARQSLKRRKQKERRAQRHREALIDVFADSINEAKKRRKANK